MLNLNKVGRPLAKIEGGTYNGMIVSVSDHFASNADDDEDQNGLIKEFRQLNIANDSKCQRIPDTTEEREILYITGPDSRDRQALQDPLYRGEPSPDERQGRSPNPQRGAYRHLLLAQGMGKIKIILEEYVGLDRKHVAYMKRQRSRACIIFKNNPQCFLLQNEIGLLELDHDEQPPERT